MYFHEVETLARKFVWEQDKHPNEHKPGGEDFLNAILRVLRRTRAASRKSGKHEAVPRCARVLAIMMFPPEDTLIAEGRLTLGDFLADDRYGIPRRRPQNAKYEEKFMKLRDRAKTRHEIWREFQRDICKSESWPKRRMLNPREYNDIHIYSHRRSGKFIPGTDEAYNENLPEAELKVFPNKKRKSPEEFPEDKEPPKIQVLFAAYRDFHEQTRYMDRSAKCFHARLRKHPGSFFPIDVANHSISNNKLLRLPVQKAGGEGHVEDDNAHDNVKRALFI